MCRLFLGIFEVFIVTFTHRDLSKISMGKFTICQMFLDLQVNLLEDLLDISSWITIRCTSRSDSFVSALSFGQKFFEHIFAPTSSPVSVET